MIVDGWMMMMMMMMRGEGISWDSAVILNAIAVENCSRDCM
jgi:hypothetical protein